MNQQLLNLTESKEPLLKLKASRLAGIQPLDHPLDLVRTSPLVTALFSLRGPDGRIPHHPYGKWFGAHWVLAVLSELDYPGGDPDLVPLRDQQLDWLFSEEHLSSIHVFNGRTRRCASQEGYALYSQLKLGIADDRVKRLADSLVSWQWPDGGWNCDKNPDAAHSSFHESWMPLRGLTIYARLTGNPAAKSTVERAADLFLSHHLFRRSTTGAIIKPDFTKLHYPWYWHYDYLAGLKAISENGSLSDERCQEALDLLASKQLPDGGFPLQGSYILKKVSNRWLTGMSNTEFGSVNSKEANPFVTLEAIEILQAAGR